MRQNSQQIVSPYRKENFYSLLERTAPSVGDNDSSVFSVPTKVKLAGTDDSAIISSDSSIAAANFPATEDLLTGVPFDAQGVIGGGDFGNTMVRITLMDVLAEDPALDFGAPPNPAPETDFYPVYRIDAMTANDRGSHVYGSVIGDVIHVFDIGIYGEDYLEIRQACDSYDSSAGGYTTASRRAQLHSGLKFYRSRSQERRGLWIAPNKRQYRRCFTIRRRSLRRLCCRLPK